ncbi:MAG: glycoside hydrolase family 13 protein [Prevotella sp.]|nr:glycoside hydrolase family 13 protein [Prevotella sp.]
MKRVLVLTALVAQLLTMSAAKSKVTIDRIEPTDWYVGMKNPQVQLMVYGKGIRDIQRVETDYPGVHVDSLVRLDSPNYLFVYLNIKDAKPGTMKLTFVSSDSKVKAVSVAYELKVREMSGDKRYGFTNADVLYMLMPDRFAQGVGHNPQVKGMRAYKEDRSKPSLRHGGDLNGIREHLDYFCELGVTALWLTPVLENDSPDSDNDFSTYHGYATTNYYRVDPRFGTNDDYRRLVDEAHDRGLKVVMDMIFNHSGFEHPWTSDMPSKDWLNVPEWLTEAQGTSASSYLQTSYKLTPVLDPYASKVDLKETVEGWFVPTMPDLNQHNPHLMRYLIQNSKWWIETIGIDGIRMDTYPYAYADAMSAWMKELSEEYPHFNTVGETWVTEPAYTAAWQANSRLAAGIANSYLPTVMDFSFFDKLNQAKNEETDAWWNGLNRLYNSFVYDYLYPNPSSVMAFIENHDTDRFLGNGKDSLMLKQALALLLTVNRIPQLYYGTEILMNGTKEVTDGNVRKDFPGGFPGDSHNAFTREGRSRAEQSMFQWLSRLLHWRQNNPVITRGRQTQFIPFEGVYVIARQYEGKTALTVLNGTSKPATMQVKRYGEVIGSTTRARDVLTGRYYDLSGDLTLKPRQSLVLEY